MKKKHKSYKLSVCGVPYNLIFTTSNSQGKRTLGWTDTTDKLIFIRKGLRPHTELEVMAHEYAHAYLYESGNSSTLEDKEEEARAQFLGIFLSTFIRDKEAYDE